MTSKSDPSVTSDNHTTRETAESKAFTMTHTNHESITSDNTSVSKETAEQAKAAAMNAQKHESITSEHEATCAHGEPAVVADPRTLGAALDKVMPAAMALESSDLIAVNIDGALVASLVIAVAARMEKYRGYFLLLPDYDMTAFDGLAVTGQALALAQTDYRYAIAPPDELARILERGADLRSTFQHAGDALADGGMLAKEQIAAMRGGTSHRDLATALTGWPRVLLAADWSAIKQRSLLTDAMLTEAHQLAQDIFAFTGDRNLSPEKIAAVSDLRQRVLTLAVRRYDEVRRGASFMRWHQDDADVVVPSLYSQSRGRTDVKAAPEAGTPAQPVIVAGPAVPTPEVKKPGVAPAVGLPNSSPFIS